MIKCKYLEYVNRTNIIVGIVIIIIEMAIASWLYMHILNIDNEKNNEVLSVLDEKIIQSFNRTIVLTEYSLERNNAFIRLHGKYITNDNFSNYIQYNTSPIKNNTDFFIWIPMIRDSELLDLDKFCGKYDTKNCTLKIYDDISREFIVEKKANRSAYWPILTIDPIKSANEKIIGYDYGNGYSNAFGNEYEMKRDILEGNGNTIISGKIKTGIIDESRKSQFFLGKLGYDNTNRTQANITGISLAVLNINNITDNFDIRDEASNFDIFIFSRDMYGNIGLVYKHEKYEHDDIQHMNQIKGLSSEYEVGVANKKWIICIKYSEKYLNSLRGMEVVIIPAILVCLFLIVDIIYICSCIIFELMKEKSNITKEKSKIASDMLAYFNHEVRNPLNVIKGLLELNIDQLGELTGIKKCNTMCDDFLTDVKDETYVKTDMKNFRAIVSDLHTTLASCALMEHIVNDILVIKKLETGNLLLDNRVIDMIEYIDSIRRTMIQKFNEKPFVKFEINCIDIHKIYIDRIRLTQILLNYLTNALKYTDEGTIVLNIYKKMDMIRFDVIDTGMGISDDKKTKIFVPFDHENIEEATRHGEFGLGLYMCNSLATLMGGSVGFYSKYGSGSTFWIEFSCAIIQNDIDGT